MHDGERGLNVVWKRHARRTVRPPAGRLLARITGVLDAYPFLDRVDAAPVFDAERGWFSGLIVARIVHPLHRQPLGFAR